MESRLKALLMAAEEMQVFTIDIPTGATVSCSTDVDNDGDVDLL
jgi:hypothetical protein